MKVLLILLAMLVSAGSAYAARGNLAVSALIPLNNGSCSVQGTQAINFGSLTPLNPQSVVTASGSITYKCKGLGNSGATIAVTLASPTPLTLKLSATPGYSIPYSVELPTSTYIPPNGTGTLAIPITAQILGTDYKLAPAGTYADTITVTLTP